MTAKSYARVIGANDRIRVGFVGVGGREWGTSTSIHDLEKSEQRRRHHRRRLLEDAGRRRGRRVQRGQGGQRLSARPRQQGRRLRHDRHPRALARRRDDCRPRRGQAGLLRKADDAHHPAGAGRAEETERRPACRCRSACRPCRTTATRRPASPSARACSARSCRHKSNTSAATIRRARGASPTSTPACPSRATWIGTRGSAWPPKSTGTRTTTSSGGTTRHIRAASAPTCSSIASPAS